MIKLANICKWWDLWIQRCIRSIKICIYNRCVRKKHLLQCFYWKQDDFLLQWSYWWKSRLFLVKNQEKDWVVVEKDRFEHDYDKNKDGKLDKDEMRGWLVPDIKQNAKDETNHLFENADKNKDNLLSIDEIVDQHDLFVGSEATNYGDHLENMKHTEL